MRRLFVAASLWITFFAAAASTGGQKPGDGGLYGRRIIVETGARDTVTPADRLYAGLSPPKETAEELSRWLRQITGRTFTVDTPSTDNRAGALYLLRTDSALVAAADRERLRDKGLEAFIIRGDASRLQIIANDLRGLSHGAYFYLEQLGVRWLLSGVNWTVVPKRSDVTLTISRLVEPAFFSRTYGGSGGFYSWVVGRGYTGSAASRASGQSEFELEWTAWSRHLRNGGQALGHATGEAFVSDPRVLAVLKAHPEYLAKIDGAYTKLYLPAARGAGHGQYVWDTTAHNYVKAIPSGTGTHDFNDLAKLNAGNPKAVALYFDWILQGLREARSRPGGYAIRTVSVEPSDGTGEGNNYEELRTQGVGDGSESDQEFYIANYCARKVRAEFPDVSVVMLAYAQRSDPPTFPLEPNFIVQPAFAFRYGRKTAGLSNEEWLALWKAKAKTLAVYDYWSIPDWSHDEPTFNFLDVAKKLRYYHDNHVKGICAETTVGGGAMGIGQYVASHVMWDPDLDERALIEDWYQNAFGPAKTPMKRMLERWAHGYRPISAELGASYCDIDEAERLAVGNPAILAQVDDFARYLHYLRLRDELFAMPAGPAKDKKISSLSEYLFDINDSRMVHTTRIVDQGYPAAWAEFRVHDPRAASDPPDGPGWARVHPLSHAEVAALVADGKRCYPPPDFTIKTYTGKLVPLAAHVWQPPAGDPWGPAMPVSSATVDLRMPEGLAAFPLRISRLQDNKLTVTDDAGRTIYRHTVTKAAGNNPNKWTWDEMRVPLAPGHYQLHFAGKEGRLGLFLFQTWKGVPLVLRTFQTQKFAPSPQLFFYVPRGVRKIAMYFPYTDQCGGFETPVYLPSGQRAAVEHRDGGKLMIVSVPPDQDGKAWWLERLVQPYENFETLTVPQAFSLSPETLLVPGDAL